MDICPPISHIFKYISGSGMVATFWPTVGTVLPERGCSVALFESVGRKRAFIWFSRVVLPALSRPRSRTEYSILLRS